MRDMSMIIPNVSKKGQGLKKSRKLARAMRAVFGTGENLSFELAGWKEGIEVTPRTCNRWMACQSKPDCDTSEAIEDLILEIGTQKANAIMAHVEAVCGRA